MDHRGYWAKNVTLSGPTQKTKVPTFCTGIGRR